MAVNSEAFFRELRDKLPGGNKEQKNLRTNERKEIRSQIKGYQQQIDSLRKSNESLAVDVSSHKLDIARYDAQKKLLRLNKDPSQGNKASEYNILEKEKQTSLKTYEKEISKNNEEIKILKKQIKVLEDQLKKVNSSDKMERMSSEEIYQQKIQEQSDEDDTLLKIILRDAIQNKKLDLYQEDYSRLAMIINPLHDIAYRIKDYLKITVEDVSRVKGNFYFAFESFQNIRTMIFTDGIKENDNSVDIKNFVVVTDYLYNKLNE